MAVHFLSAREGPHLRGARIVAEPAPGLPVGGNRIGGAWGLGTDGGFLKIDSPATGAPVGTLGLSFPADVDRAVRAAKAAREGLTRMGTFARAALCMAVADEIAHLLCLKQGKPFHAEARPQVDGAALGFRNTAEQMKCLETAVFPLADADKRAFSFLQPKGVFAIIKPWNSPAALPCLYYLGPALATGDAVVWIPAPTTSLIATLLMECMIAADLPAGAVDVVLGDSAVVGDAAVTHRHHTLTKGREQ